MSFSCRLNHLEFQKFVVLSLSHVQLFATPWTAAHQASLSFAISQSLLKLMSIESMMPSNHFILCHLLLLLPSIFPSITLLQWVGPSHQVAEVLEFQLQPQSFQWIFTVYFLKDWLVWSFCCSRDSQEFFPAPPFESINCSALSLLYGPSLTSVHDNWKYSFDYTDLSLQSGVSALQYAIWVCHSFSSKEQASFNFMAAVTITMILDPEKTKSVTVSIASLSICHEVMRPDAVILVFWMLSFKPAFSLSSFTFIKRVFSSFLFSAIRYHLYICVLVTQSCLTLCNPMECSPRVRLLCPWNFPGKNIGAGCRFLLQGIFPTQGLNLGFPNYGQILYLLSHQRSPSFLNAEF